MNWHSYISQEAIPTIYRGAYFAARVIRNKNTLIGDISILCCLEDWMQGTDTGAVEDIKNKKYTITTWFYYNSFPSQLSNCLKQRYS
jgi:hypothetical protein